MSSLRGEVAYLYAFDIAYELKREPIREILGQPVAQFCADTSRRTPRHLFFHQPQMVRLPAWERHSSRGSVTVNLTLKFLPVGAISITARVPFAVASLRELVAYHDLQFTNGSLHDEIHRLAEEAREALKPYCLRPFERLMDEEAYTVFCLDSEALAAAGMGTEEWMRRNCREIAAVLLQEDDIETLAQQEVIESTSRYLCYYERDLVVVDWDAALVVEEQVNFDQVLHVLELANIQLAELEAYDRLLDENIDRAYRDLRSPRRRRVDLLREIQEMRIDMARMNDEIENTSKFFGDWHLARLYRLVGQRFHLADWWRSVDAKLKMLDDLYQMLKQDEQTRWMLILEFSIVVLFIVDLLILFFLSH